MEVGLNGHSPSFKRHEQPGCMNDKLSNEGHSHELSMLLLLAVVGQDFY